MAITTTTEAAKRIQSQLVKRGRGLGLRLGVKTTGCSGLAYKLEFVDAVGGEDVIFETNGVTIVIDAKSLKYLDGTELDYTKENIQEGFIFNNPYVKAECGCGESFTV